MSSGLEALIFGIRRVYSALVELPERAALSFDDDDFDVVDDEANGWTAIQLKPKADSPHRRVAHATIGTSYAVSATTDFHITMSGTNLVATLPLNPVNGDRYEFKSNGTGNSINGHGKNLDGASTYTMIQNEAVTVHYNGIQWELV